MSKAESAGLILKLYETRRDETMRAARSWMVSFFPESADDVIQALVGAETSAYFRMVTTYWEMAATFVNQGAIDFEMFNEANSEHIVCFSKLEPYLDKVRGVMGNPAYLKNLEQLIMQLPNAREILENRRVMVKRMIMGRSAQ